MDFLLAQYGLHYILDLWTFGYHIRIITFEAGFRSLIPRYLMKCNRIGSMDLFCISFTAQATYVWVSQVFYRRWRLCS